MGGTTSAANEPDNFSDDELKAFQSQLASLVRETTAYPLEYSLGTYDFLFESRDDIEVILDNVSQEILVARKPPDLVPATRYRFSIFLNRGTSNVMTDQATT
jgi:hypothetical protein